MRLYVPIFKKEPIFRWSSFEEKTVWNNLQKAEACGLDRDIYPTKQSLKKDGWKVLPHVLVEETEFKDLQQFYSAYR